MTWWRRRKHTSAELDEYVARERAAVEAVCDDTRRHAAETRSLRAESTRNAQKVKRIVEANQFTVWLNQAIRGVQEDGR